jgi:hypothetical protein
MSRIPQFARMISIVVVIAVTGCSQKPATPLYRPPMPTPEVKFITPTENGNVVLKNGKLEIVFEIRVSDKSKKPFVTSWLIREGINHDIPIESIEEIEEKSLYRVRAVASRSTFKRAGKHKIVVRASSEAIDKYGRIAPYPKDSTIETIPMQFNVLSIR